MTRKRKRRRCYYCGRYSTLVQGKWLTLAGPARQPVWACRDEADCERAMEPRP